MLLNPAVQDTLKKIQKEELTNWSDNVVAFSKIQRGLYNNSLAVSCML